MRFFYKDQNNPPECGWCLISLVSCVQKVIDPATYLHTCRCSTVRQAMKRSWKGRHRYANFLQEIHPLISGTFLQCMRSHVQDQFALLCLMRCQTMTLNDTNSPVSVNGSTHPETYKVVLSLTCLRLGINDAKLGQMWRISCCFVSFHLHQSPSPSTFMALEEI